MNAYADDYVSGRAARGHPRGDGRDKRVYILGEDIAGYGGTYSVTKGLFEEFGEKRVRDTPLAEEVIVGTALGSALGGLRPIAELMTMNFSLLASDLIVNSPRQVPLHVRRPAACPIVIRMPGGGGAQRGAQHSQFLRAGMRTSPASRSSCPPPPTTPRACSSRPCVTRIPSSSSSMSCSIACVARCPTRAWSIRCR